MCGIGSLLREGGLRPHGKKQQAKLSHLSFFLSKKKPLNNLDYLSI